MQPPRIAKRGDEQKHLDRRFANQHATHAEINLQLLPRRGLEPYRYPGRGDQIAPHWYHRPLDRPQADHFSAANSWRTTSALPACRANRSTSQSDNPSSCFDRDGDAHGCQSPADSQRRTVLREHPSSAAMRLDPHPNAFSLSIADTSSGAFINFLR
jgi:hypothetical protein